MTKPQIESKAYTWITGVNLFLSMILVMLGAVVHNTGSSLACPDWPLCFGQVFPEMKGQVAIEHSHRLLGAAVGLLSIAMLVLARGSAAFNMTLIALGLVIFQGLLGGLTVLLRIHPLVTTLHLAMSQVYVGLLFYLLLRSRPSWACGIKSKHNNSLGEKIKRRLLIATTLLFIQIVFGASIRHLGAGVACGLGWQASTICQDPVTAELSLWPSVWAAQLHWLHRVFGVLLVGLLVWATLPALRWAKSNEIKTESACFSKTWRLQIIIGVHILILLQVLLGVWTIGSYIGIWAVSAHMLVAMLLWLNLLKLLFDARVIFQTKELASEQGEDY